MKDMKETFSKYKSAIVSFCKKLPRANPFIKNMLRFLQEQTTKEPASVQGK